MTSILLAIVIGAAFGAVLDRIGATNPNWIGGMLTVRGLANANSDLYPEKEFFWRLPGTLRARLS